MKKKKKTFKNAAAGSISSPFFFYRWGNWASRAFLGFPLIASLTQSKSGVEMCVFLLLKQLSFLCLLHSLFATQNSLTFKETVIFQDVAFVTRKVLGRELGGGFRMGNTCTPMADSSQCMAKPTQCCKVKLIN